jgi:hypothetical protein
LLGETWIGVPYGNNSIKEKSLLQMGALGELPQKDENVDDDDQEIDDRKVL